MKNVTQGGGSKKNKKVSHNIWMGPKILINELGQTGDQIHIIGHSLGAHLAGFIGRTMSKGNYMISRVTGENFVTTVK